MAHRPQQRAVIRKQSPVGSGFIILTPEILTSDPRREGADRARAGAPVALGSEGPSPLPTGTPGVGRVPGIPPVGRHTPQPAADSIWLHSTWRIYGPIKY